ncbi:MAG TPA: aspartyl/asparaginyl beta-hydroxylase domain-containing protein [Bacteroidia bacterium]|nr:aspartyl/asparaginyl beta-hydroxylase domain-containing protein [Bacteroidia bacterium]
MDKIRYPFFDGTSEEEKTFYNVSDFSWAKELEANWEIIKKEVIAYMQDPKNLHPYFAKDLMNEPEKWQTFGLYAWGVCVSKKNCEACPETIKILEKIPTIISAGVSVMEPNAEIKPHFGDTNATVRCHLGLVVPAGLPEIGFHVGYEDRSWEEGKLLLFNDAAYHKAWNNTQARRVILLFDVMRPEFATQKRDVCATVLGILSWQFITLKLPFLRILPKIIQKPFCWLLSRFVLLYFSFLKRSSAWL